MATKEVEKTNEQRDCDDLLFCGEDLDGNFEGQIVRDVLISTLLKIRDKEGRLVRLKPNRAQREFSTRFEARSIVLKARQMGITTWVAARFFISTITKRGTLTVLVAHDQPSAEEIFRIVHRFWENLPKRLRTGALRTSRANVRQLVFPLLDSEYRVETAADPDAGRGLTIQNLHGSEVARWPHDAAATLASLRAAVPPKGEVVLESTPRGAVGCFYSEWQRAEETKFTTHFYPWWWEEMYSATAVNGLPDLTAEERELKERHGLSDGQIAYRREIQASFRALAKQEYAEDAESCFLKSGDCLFDVEAIDKRLLECIQPISEEPEVRHHVTIFAPPQERREYIIGVDPAGGGSEGDYACAQVVDRRSGMQCAELHGHLTPEELAARVCELGMEYHGALLAVEKNNQGFEVLAHLRRNYRYPGRTHINGNEGMLTTRKSRPEIIAALASVLAAEPKSFQSPRLLREMRTFVRRHDGSGTAATGSHDDCVMAMGIALRARELVAGDAWEKNEELLSLGMARRNREEFPKSG